MTDAIITKIHSEYVDISGYLLEAKQITFHSDLERYFRKVFILSIASQYEAQIQEILLEFVSHKSANSAELLSFFRKKAISMNYHTFFDWGKKDKIEEPGANANTFFALFGDEFKRVAIEEVRKCQILEAGIKAFLELGHIRNILVHSNFAAYPFENKTISEIMELKTKADIFVLYIRSKLLSVPAE